jgi:coenzyme F420 hydrogenase subunit beta
MTGFDRLNEEVVQAGLCTDCGTCAAVCPTRAIGMNYETEEPELIGRCAPHCSICSDTCAGKDIDIPGLNRVSFGRDASPDEALLGVTQGYLKAYAADPAVRDAGAAGGVVSALLIYALEADIIDGAIVTGMSETEPWRVVPRIATTRDEVLASAQSRYAAVPTNAIIKEALGRGLKRLGAVGLPCHIHGLRKIQAAGMPKQIRDSLVFNIGILCGANSHHRGTEHMIVEQVGVPLEQVTKVEFRGGPYPGRFQVTTRDGILVPRPYSMMVSIAGFYRDRCLMCYDYPAELADLAVGDYFHPDMRSATAGWSVIILRSDQGNSLVAQATDAGYLHTEPVDMNYLLGAGWEMKRHAAVNRILERRRHGWPVPDYHLPMEYPAPMYREVDTAPPYVVDPEKKDS